MAERYIESIIIRQDNVLLPEDDTLLFEDTDLDAEFELKAKIKLVQIVKNVQNQVHNHHQYVLKIVSVDELKKEVT